MVYCLNKHNSLHLAENLLRYLSLEIMCSSKLTTLRNNCFLLGRNNVHGQISQHAFFRVKRIRLLSKTMGDETVELFSPNAWAEVPYVAISRSHRYSICPVSDHEFRHINIVKAILKMLRRNSLLITGRTHEKPTSIFFQNRCNM